MVTPARGALHDRNSLSWRFNSQSFVLLGGPRAAILQVCDPGVAAGVAEFSSYRTDPFGRLERTLESMLAIGFGSPERRREVLDRLERIHSAVQGQLDDGTPYSALDPQRQYWVLATLTDEQRALCELLAAGLSGDEIATRLGVRRSTVYRRRGELRVIFAKAGLGSWLEGWR